MGNFFDQFDQEDQYRSQNAVTQPNPDGPATHNFFDEFDEDLQPEERAGAKVVNEGGSELDAFIAKSKTELQKLFEPVKKVVMGEHEDYPELRGVMQGQIESADTPEGKLEALRRQGFNNAQLSQDQYGNPLVTPGQFEGPVAPFDVDPQGTYYFNKPGMSRNDLSYIDAKVKEYAPVIAGGGATAPLKAAIGVPAMGVAGAVTEAERQAGNKMNAGEDMSAASIATTGGLTMFGDAVGRGAVTVLSPILKRAFGDSAKSVLNQDGTFTDDALKILKQRDIDPGALSAEMNAALSKKGVLTASQADNFNQFKQAGINPTRAQVTQSADDFQLQQELYKRSGPVREAVEAADNKLATTLDDMVVGTGGKTTEAFQAGSSVSEVIKRRMLSNEENIGKIYKKAFSELDDLSRATDFAGKEMDAGLSVSQAIQKRAIDQDLAISKLYKEASKSLPDGKLRLESLQSALDNMDAEDMVSRGIISAAKGKLKALGGMQKPNYVTDGVSSIRVDSKVSFGRAEEYRQFLNELWKTADGRGRATIKALKNALDDDVFRQGGTDFFEKAREAKSLFESGLGPAKMNKFDKSTKSLVRDILESKVAPEDIFQKSVLSKSGGLKELEHLKSYLGSDEAGAQAWTSVRKAAIRHILDNGGIIKGADDGANAVGLDKAIAGIGKEKMNVLFSSKERLALAQMMKAQQRVDSEISLTGGTSFSKNGDSLVKRIVTGKMQPDDVLDKAILSKSGKVNDLEHLKAYLNKDGVGAQAWDDLRGQTLQHLVDKATLSKGEAGRTFSGPTFKRALESIGQEKMKVLFTPEERFAIYRLRDLAIKKTPVAGTALGKGPTGQGFTDLVNELKGANIITRLLTRAKEYKGVRAMTSPTRETVNALKDGNVSASRRLLPAGGSAEGYSLSR